MNQKHVLLLIINIAVLLGGRVFNSTPVMLIAGLGLLVWFAMAAKNNQEAAHKAGQQLQDTDKLLRQALTDTHKLALSTLSGADDALKNEVIGLLIEAGTHLSNPYINSRLVVGPALIIDWHRAGLTIAAKAKQLIEDYAAKNSAQA
jgi:hypothetical protein